MPDPVAGTDDLKIPRHLAIIMDGNGRWARKRGLPRFHGHRTGVNTVKTIVSAARELGIEYLTLFSFSTENWSRPKEEIGELLKLLKIFIRKDLAELHQNNVRVRVIGERSNLAPNIANLLNEAENLTRNNTAHTLVIAFNYGSRHEIASAAKKLAQQAVDGTIKPEEINEKLVSDNLDTADIPDPDMILRTSGEIRLSNFLMWQAAYAELIFTDQLWPDFTIQDLIDAVSEYSSRKRRYGGLDKDRAVGERGT